MHSSSKSSYLRITEPEIQAAKVSEEAEASEEDPVLESGNRTENDNMKLKTITMERRARALLCPVQSSIHLVANIATRWI